MSITIEIYERTGPAGSPTDQLVTNMNWKSQSLPDSLYKYYYYPIRLVDGNGLINCSVPKYLYAKISGTYASAKRLRWQVKGVVEEGTHVLATTSPNYATPTPAFQGGMTAIQDGAYYFPRLTAGSAPGASPVATPVMAANTTYCTEFLVTQFIVDSSMFSVGNSSEILVSLTLDEYE